MRRRQLIGAAAAAGALAVTGTQASTVAPGAPSGGEQPPRQVALPAGYVQFTSITLQAVYVKSANVGAVVATFYAGGVGTTIYVNGGAIQVRDSIATVLAALGR